jgi:hypothetical protein
MSDDVEQLNTTGGAETIEPLISNPEGNYIQNYEILSKLEAEETRLKTTFGIESFLAVAATELSVATLLAIPELTAVGFTAEYITRVRRLYSITKSLLEYFGDEGIKITLRVQTNAGLIDLFVKMSDKRHFALLLRSNGNCSARWREDKQAFFVYKPGKHPKKWTGLSDTARQLKATMELKQAKSPLLGTSRADRDRPIIKTIVLCGNSKIYPSHTAELSDFGQTKALTLRVEPQNLIFLIEEKDLIDFLLPAPQKVAESLNQNS